MIWQKLSRTTIRVGVSISAAHGADTLKQGVVEDADIAIVVIELTKIKICLSSAG